MLYFTTLFFYLYFCFWHVFLVWFCKRITFVFLAFLYLDNFHFNFMLHMSKSSLFVLIPYLVHFLFLVSGSLQQSEFLIS